MVTHFSVVLSLAFRYHFADCLEVLQWLEPQRCKIPTNKDVLSSFNIFEFLFVCKELVYFFLDTNLAVIGIGLYLFSVLVLPDVLPIYHLVGEQLRANLLLRTRFIPIIIFVFILQ